MDLKYGHAKSLSKGEFGFETTEPYEVGLQGEAAVREGVLVITGLSIFKGGSASQGVTSSDLREIRIGEIKRKIADDIRRDPSILTTAAGLSDIPKKAAATPHLLNPAEQAWLPYVTRAVAIGIDLDEAEKQALADAARTAALIGTASPSRGRGASSDEFYREIALAYLLILQDNPHRVILQLAQILQERREDHHLNRNTVSTWVRRAREEGWLTRSTQGKAGGSPGPRLVEWLENQQEEEE